MWSKWPKEEYVDFWLVLSLDRSSRLGGFVVFAVSYDNSSVRYVGFLMSAAMESTK